MKQFIKKSSVRAFLAFTAVYAVALGFIFMGAWSPDKVIIAPDCGTTFAPDDASVWLSQLLRGSSFIPSDLMHVIGGMYFWVELQFALAAWLAALGVAYYLRGRGLSFLASYGGGASFGLMGYCFTLYSAGHLGWFNWLMYGTFAFGLTDRAVRFGRWHNWAMLGVVLAWAGARQPDLWLLFTALNFAYGLWCIVREGKSVNWPRLLCGVIVTGVCTLLVGMPQFKNAIVNDIAGREKQISDFSTSSTAADDPVAKEKAKLDRWLFCTSWSLPPEDTLEFAIPEIHGGSNDPRIFQKPGNKPYAGRLGQHAVVPEGHGGRHPVTGKKLKGGDHFWMPYRQHSLYFGLITLAFAFAGGIGFFAMRKNGEGKMIFGDAPFWIGASVIVYLCALGGFTPFYKLIFALPFGDMMRCPVKFVHLLEFSSAVLCGFGIEFVCKRFGSSRSWPIPLLAAILVVNVFDLARIDRKYFAVRDVSFLRAKNEAAEDVAKLGGGKVYVAVPPQEGGLLVAESLVINHAETSDNRASSDVRFVLAGATALRNDAALSEQMRSGALKSAGMYVYSQNGGIRKSVNGKASLVLLQNPKVNAPEKTDPPVDNLAVMLIVVSLLATVSIPTWSIFATMKLRRIENSSNV